MAQAKMMTAAVTADLTRLEELVTSLRAKDQICHIKTCDALDAVAAAEEMLAQAKAAAVEAREEGALITEALWEAQKEAFIVDRSLRMAQADELRLTPMTFVTISTAGLAVKTTGGKDSRVVLGRAGEGQVFKIIRITEGDYAGCVELEAHGGEADGLLLNNCGHLNKEVIMWNRPTNGQSKASLWSMDGDKLLSQTNNKTSPTKRFVKIKDGQLIFAAAGEGGDTFTLRRASAFLS